MSAFFAFGNIAIDDLVYADGTTLWNMAGGAAIYSALGMAVWTGRATTVAPYGPDYPRAQIAHIDFACTRALSHSMRHWGLYEDDGSRHFVSRRSSHDWGNTSPQVDDLDAGPYRYCHLGAMPWERAHAIAEALRVRGAQVISLDIHDRKLTGVTLEAYIALVERVDIFLPSMQDVAEYFPHHSAVEALRALRERLPRVAVIGVKCGSEGALIHAAGAAQIIGVPAVPAHVIDVTGAGDAFCGGFLAGYAPERDALEGALHGAVSASFALAATGTAGLVGVEGDEARARAAALRTRVTTMPFAAL